MKSAHLKIGMNHLLTVLLRLITLTKDLRFKTKKLIPEVFNKIFKDAISTLRLSPDDFGNHSARSGGATCLAPHISEYNLILARR